MRVWAFGLWWKWQSKTCLSFYLAGHDVKAISKLQVKVCLINAIVTTVPVETANPCEKIWQFTITAIVLFAAVDQQVSTEGTMIHFASQSRAGVRLLQNERENTETFSGSGIAHRSVHGVHSQNNGAFYWSALGDTILLEYVQHELPWCEHKHSGGVHCTPPLRMGEDLAKTGVVTFIPQTTFHPVHFGIHLVAIGGEHGQSRRWIDVIGPISSGPDAFAKISCKVHKGVQQSVLFFFDVCPDRYQIFLGALIGRDGQELSIVAVGNRLQWQIPFVKDVSEFPLQRFGQCVHRHFQFVGTTTTTPPSGIYSGVV